VGVAEDGKILRHCTSETVVSGEQKMFFLAWIGRPELGLPVPDSKLVGGGVGGSGWGVVLFSELIEDVCWHHMPR